jgi:hypothetical protein
MASERRDNLRMPLQLSINEYMHDHVQRSMAFNVGCGGLFVKRLQLNKKSEFLRHPEQKKVVGIEFELPKTSEVIWAAGEICHDLSDKLFVGTGIRFCGLADLHRRLIRDYVLE